MTTLVALLLVAAAPGQTKIQAGRNATSDCACAMAGVDEGIFKLHGDDVEMVLIGVNSNIPVAMLSNAIQIGGPTSTALTAAGTGHVGARYAAELSRTEPIVFCPASRQRAEKNPQVIRNFRAGIAEAAAIVNVDRDKAAVAIAKSHSNCWSRSR